MNNLEILSTDLIEDDFFNNFKPIYVLTSLLGSVRFKYKHKFITKPSLTQRLYCCILSGIAVASCYSVFLGKNFDGDLTDELRTHMPNLLQFLNITVMYVSITLSNSFINSHSNAHLFILLQQIDRNLKIIGKSEHYRRIYISNIGHFIVLVIFYLGWLLVFLMFDIHNPMVLISTITFSVEDLEMFNFATYIYFLHTRVEYINKCIQENVSSCRPKNTSINKVHLVILRRMFTAYCKITKAFSSLQNLFGIYILTVTLYSVITLLSIVQKAVSPGTIFNLSSLSALTFVCAKICSRPLYMGIAIENLCIQVKTTRVNCLLLLNTHRSGEIRKVTKNILRVLRVRMRPFSVLGVFTLDARLPLRLLALTTTYTVVLLQFAFLR